MFKFKKSPEPDYRLPLHIRREAHVITEAFGAAVGVTVYTVIAHGVHLEVMIFAMQALHYGISLHEHKKTQRLYMDLHKLHLELQKHNELKELAHSLQNKIGD